MTVAGFRLPPSLRVIGEIEWPPGSGRVAVYREYERQIIRRMAGKLPPHLPGCRAFESHDPALYDLANCPACVAWNEVAWLHGVKADFDAVIEHVDELPEA